MTNIKDPSVVYTFKVTLRGVHPTVWRRFKVDSRMSLKKLHKTIQFSMGWCDSHLHEFRYDGKTYYSDRGKSDYLIYLDELNLKIGSKLRYDYDFGDGWEHDVVLEKITEKIAGEKLPICLTGRRACPPEKIGGIRGYAELKENLKKTREDLDKETLDDIEFNCGLNFDPDKFDLKQANDCLDCFEGVADMIPFGNYSRGPIIYILKIKVLDIKPKIWRRIKICSQISLIELAETIQMYMGWKENYSYQFEIWKEILRPNERAFHFRKNLRDYDLYEGQYFILLIIIW